MTQDVSTLWDKLNENFSNWSWADVAMIGQPGAILGMKVGTAAGAQYYQENKPAIDLKVAEIKTNVSEIADSVISAPLAVVDALQNKFLILAGVALVAIWVIGRSGVLAQGADAFRAYATAGQG